jgi:hypothetical protein
VIPSSYKSFLISKELIKSFNKIAAESLSAIPVVRNPVKHEAKYS